MRIVIVCLIFLFGCKEVGQNRKYFKPYVDTQSDTVQNGQLYTAKIYFPNDSLLRIAKENNINNILNVKYETDVDGDLIFVPIVTQLATIVGDTAYISFQVEVDNLKKGQIAEYFWNYHMAVNYNSNSMSHDTLFAEMVRIFVIGIEE